MQAPLLQCVLIGIESSHTTPAHTHIHTHAHKQRHQKKKVGLAFVLGQRRLCSDCKSWSACCVLFNPTGLFDHDFKENRLWESRQGQHLLSIFHVFGFFPPFSVFPALLHIRLPLHTPPPPHHCPSTSACRKAKITPVGCSLVHAVRTIINLKKAREGRCEIIHQKEERRKEGGRGEIQKDWKRCSLRL